MNTFEKFVHETLKDSYELCDKLEDYQDGLIGINGRIIDRCLTTLENKEDLK